MSKLDLDAEQLMAQICQQLSALQDPQNPFKLIGIRSGGEWIAQKIHSQLQNPTPLGVIDISFHRDDFAKSGLNPSVKPSNIPWDVTDQHIVLIDDVLYTGRTIRAALNEIFDYGRPAKVTLVTLLDRKGCRELPIQADICGAQLTSEQRLKVTGPEPLQIEIVATSAMNKESK